MRLVLLSSTLQAGGAERVISHLANHWAAEGRSVDMVLLDGPAQPIYYHLAPEVRLTRLDLMRDSSGTLDAVQANLGRIRRLRRVLGDMAAEVVVAFLPETNVLAALATRGLATRTVVSERVSTVDEPLRQPWPLLRRLAYRLADAVVFQTERARDAFADLGPRAVVLPNPVMLPPSPSVTMGALAIVAAGRLVPQKGFDLLLEAFARLAPAHPLWSLTIWGEGPERGRLEAMVRRLGLDGRARLPGVTALPGAWLAEPASIFVLPSRYEGFPNVLAEAMAAGFATVAADCRFGPREILSHGTDGLLVPAEDPAALATALGRLMADPALRQGLGAAARQSIRRFETGVVMAGWSRLVESLAERRAAA